jgi:hypothetical protein
MKKYYFLLILFAGLFLFGACNDEWTSEQYTRYISFKAPINDEGVTTVYVRYRGESVSNYKLPLIMSGSTTNDQNLTVKVALDPDTLNQLNLEQFQSRTDLYYKQMEDRFFSMRQTVDFKSGEDVSLLDIDFSFKDINLVDKWILPLTIVDDPENRYTPHPRKHYSKALLRVMPFNDFSGTYGSTNLSIYIKGGEGGAPIVKNNIQVYAVNDSTVFFYAGMIDEDRIDRHNYKVYAKFDGETKLVTLYSDNPDMKFQSNATPIFSIFEKMDETQPYLLRRTISIKGIDYSFADYTSSAAADFEFTVKGLITMERKINTQIPDEDQAIEW